MQMRLFIMAAEHNWGFPHWNNHSAGSDRPLCQLDMKKTPRWESTSSAQDDADMGTCQWQDAFKAWSNHVQCFEENPKALT